MIPWWQALALLSLPALLFVLCGAIAATAVGQWIKDGVTGQVVFGFLVALLMAALGMYLLREMR